MASQAVAGAKRALGIASPSKEFRKIGEWTGEGLKIGIDRSSDMVRQSAEGIGNTALNAVSNSLQNLEKLTMDIDTAPTIRPVMDLSNVQHGVRAIGQMVAQPVLNVQPSVKVANSLAAATQVAPGFESDMEGTSRGDLTFIQNITSPKALSEVETYRQTKNLLSTAKEALNK
jgi:hypothetical protein